MHTDCKKIVKKYKYKYTGARIFGEEAIIFLKSPLIPRPTCLRCCGMPFGLDGHFYHP